MQNMQHSYNTQANTRVQQQPWNTTNNLQYPQAQYQQGVQPSGQGPRRASDPVRALDRNFGVTPSHNQSQGVLNQRNKSGSFQNISHAQQQISQRVPLHGQRIRGISGDSHFVNQQMPNNNGTSNQGMMYNSNTSINNGNVMNFTNNSSSNQQFSQQSSTYQHHQQQLGSNPPQNNYHQSQ